VSVSVEDLRQEFRDPEYRYGYAESFLDTYIAAQIKTLREQRKWDQAELATRIGTKQSAISRLENVNYSSWSVSTLKRLARAFELRLKISFEDFSTLAFDVQNFNARTLRRVSFSSDPFWAMLSPSVSLAEIPPNEYAQRQGASITSVLRPTAAEQEHRRPPQSITLPPLQGAQHAALGSASR
jgi:transcriptional regulator with XRE-family HTH domain